MNKFSFDFHKNKCIPTFMTVLCGVFSLFQPLYTQVDNYYVSLITNRVFDLDNYCMFLNPVLCKVIGIMNILMPEADNYTLLSRILILLGIWCISCHIAEAVHKKSELVISYAVLFVLVINDSLFYDYYTIWSAFYSFVGMVLLLSCCREEIRWKKVFGTLFVIFGFMWRKQGAMLFIPFFCLDLFIKFISYQGQHESRKRWCKKICRVCSPMFLTVFVLLSLDYGVQHSEKYRESIMFNNAAGATVDYPMKAYEDVKEILPEISQNDYESIQIRLYADTERVDYLYSERIKEAGQTTAVPLDFHGFLESNFILVQLVTGSMKTMFSCMLLFLFIICVLLSHTKWLFKLEALCCYGGAYLIMIYFASVGRVPLRVFNSILYAVFGIILVLYSGGEWGKEYLRIKWLSWLIGVAVIGVALLDIRTYNFVIPQSVFKVREGADESRWESTYQNEVRYVWMTSEFVERPLRDFIDQGKFMTDEFLEHNLFVGEWLYGQVYYNNYLNKIGLSNPMKALLEREQTYLVAEDNTMVLTYLKEHFDENVVAQKVGEIEGIPIWEFGEME